METIASLPRLFSYPLPAPPVHNPPTHLKLRGWDTVAQPCPHTGLRSRHPEGSKIKEGCLILLQSFLSISIRVSSVGAYSTCLWKISQFRPFCWLSSQEKWEPGSWSGEGLWREKVAGGQTMGRKLSHPFLYKKSTHAHTQDHFGSISNWFSSPSPPFPRGFFERT